MIKKISIQNYKSVFDLELDLGRVNIFIGENGCGKTSILEAIALGSAAYDNKNDNEFLSSRGVRITEPELMKSAFSKKSQKKDIKISFYNNSDSIEYSINVDKHNKNLTKVSLKSEALEKELVRTPSKEELQQFVERLFKNPEKFGATLAEKNGQKAISLDVGDDEIAYFQKLLARTKVDTFIDYQKDFLSKFLISNFLIYSPENFFLRRFEEEGQIRPLGIRGEGLFSHLVSLFKDNKAFADELKQNLRLINWFEDMETPTELSFGEKKINIKDRYLKDTISYFDQRSSNEGFLYLLFYFTLFLSDFTPKFFAIDNVDNALNPKLCSALIENLIKISSKKRKQVILTTHNPSILDGLDLSNDQQRLFVIYRNADGHTTAKRIFEPKKIKNVEPIRLSEAFVRGYLGGLPKNF